MTAADEATITLARETIAQVGEIGAMIGAVAGWGEDALAGGAPDRWVAHQMIDAGRLIARAARGETVTP